MDLAIMQPYFFPYIGYFQLMASVDHWVFFDDVQFVNKGWVNRNRILHPEPAKEWQFLTLPLADKSRFSRISELKISSQNWASSMRGQMLFLKKKAPYFQEALMVFDTCIDQDEKNLGPFLVEALRRISEMLGLRPTFHVQSQENWAVGSVAHAGQWALRISERLEADRYINPVGGRELFQASEFQEAGIELAFHVPDIGRYNQDGRPFVAGLSILDVVMWNGLKETRAMVQSGRILS